jgi:hypothetical protein
VACRRSHPAQELEARVRIPPVFSEIIAMLLCIIDLLCIASVFTLERGALATICLKIDLRLLGNEFGENEPARNGIGFKR